MEINKRYYVKNLLLDGKQMTNDETCELLKLNDDGTCLVANEDGEALAKEVGAKSWSWIPAVILPRAIQPQT